MSTPTDADGTRLRRTPDGDLVPDPDDADQAERHRADAIRRCREAIRTADKQEPR